MPKTQSQREQQDQLRRGLAELTAMRYRIKELTPLFADPPGQFWREQALWATDAIILLAEQFQVRAGGSQVRGTRIERWQSRGLTP